MEPTPGLEPGTSSLPRTCTADCAKKAEGVSGLGLVILIAIRLMGPQWRVELHLAHYERAVLPLAGALFILRGSAALRLLILPDKKPQTLEGGSQLHFSDVGGDGRDRTCVAEAGVLQTRDFPSYHRPHWWRKRDSNS